MEFFYFISSVLIWWLPLLALGYFLFTTEFFQTSINRVKNTYKRLKVLRNLVATQHESSVRVIFYTGITALKTCGVMIFKICWVNFLQYLNNTIVQEGRFYCVTYCIKGQMYKIRVIPPRGPDTFLEIVDENYNDVTDEISPYLRAQRSMIHHFSPDSFKKENLQIITADEDGPYEFNKDERIILKNEEDKLGSLNNPSIPNLSQAPDPIQNLLGGLFSVLSEIQKPTSVQKMSNEQKID